MSILKSEYGLADDDDDDDDGLSLPFHTNSPAFQELEQLPVTEPSPPVHRQTTHQQTLTETLTARFLTLLCIKLDIYTIFTLFAKLLATPNS